MKLGVRLFLPLQQFDIPTNVVLEDQQCIKEIHCPVTVHVSIDEIHVGIPTYIILQDGKRVEEVDHAVTVGVA